MTEDDDNCLGDLSHLSEETKDHLIEHLHEGLHQLDDDKRAAIRNMLTVADALGVMAQQLAAGDMLGQRARTMRLVAMQLDSIAAVTYASLGISEKDIQEMDAFTDIVSQLEDDPDLQFPPKGQDD